MKRELGTFERALVISDQYAPFHSVYVLRLKSPPPPQVLGQAMRSVQNHHPFLRAHLLEENGKYFFTSLVEPSMPFHVLPRWNGDHWLKVAEVELETRIELSLIPMFRCIYLYNENHGHAEIVLTFSHSIVDDSSASHLMHELLTTCASLLDEKTVTVYEFPPAPALESRFPSAYRGVRLSLRRLGYATRQIVDEIGYRIQTREKRVPPLHQKPSHGHILSTSLPEAFLETLKHRAELEKVTLDGILHAALMIAVNRHLYTGESVPMRTFSFWDLRPYVEPPLKSESLACYISLLRHSIPVGGGINIWKLASTLQRKFCLSLKSGDHFVAATMTEPMLKFITSMRSFRMGSTALNYHGESQLRPNYGKIGVTDLHGYVSAYDLGPEFSGQVRLFDGQLIWDFTYLDNDMNQDDAIVIVEEIRSILDSAVKSPLFRI